MVTGIRLIDDVVAEWSWGDYTPLSLARASLWWLPFLILLFFPALRVRSRRWAERHVAASQSLSLVWAILLSLAIFSPLMQIEWGLTDDYELVELFDDQGHFPAAKFSTELRTYPELGGALKTQGNAPRFRPVYYFWKFSELFGWGDQPHGFGFDRLLCLILFLWGMHRAFQNFTDPLTAALLTSSLLVFRCHYDIWPRLGPSEAQAAIGLAFFAAGFSRLWTRPNSSFRASLWKSLFPWLVMDFGLLWAVGSKENFVVLILPWGFLILRELYQRRTPRVALVANSVTLLLCGGFLAILKYKINLTRNQNIYGTEVHSQALASLLPAALKSYFFSGQGIALLIFLAIVLLVLCNASLPVKNFRRTLGDILLIAACFAGLYVSQFLFYAGDLDWRIGGNARYEFPAVFCWFLPAGLIAYRATSTSVLHGVTPWTRRQLWCLVTILAFLPGILGGPHHLATFVRTQIDDTRALKNFLDQAAALCHADPQRSLIIEATTPLSFEQAVLSMPKALRHAKIKNPLYLRFPQLSANAQAKLQPLFRNLLPEMQRISSQGGRGFLPWPANSANPLHNPLVITMDQEKPLTPGQHLGRIPYRW